MRVRHIQFLTDQQGWASYMRVDYSRHANIWAFRHRHTRVRSEVRDTVRLHIFGA